MSGKCTLVPITFNSFLSMFTLYSVNISVSLKVWIHFQTRSYDLISCHRGEPNLTSPSVSSLRDIQHQRSYLPVCCHVPINGDHHPHLHFCQLSAVPVIGLLNTHTQKTQKKCIPKGRSSRLSQSLA